MSALVLSLDFELFWGVTESKTLANYGANIAGVWHALPGMLKLFKKYNVHATWATVGMLMCKDFRHWSDLRPAILPTYNRDACLTYAFSSLAKAHPKLFFAPNLVEQILTTEGQELGSHSYSHFYCGETNATLDQFAADLACVKAIFSEYGQKPTSFVFPRNQIVDGYLQLLLSADFKSYRGNQSHALYRQGQLADMQFKNLARVVKLVDAYLPLTGNHISVAQNSLAGQLVNLPASMFLRPVSKFTALNALHLHRVKSGMLNAAKTQGVFHLWWHPHNFGRNPEANLHNLEMLLMYYRFLNQSYGMRSLSMSELAEACRIY